MKASRKAVSMVSLTVALSLLLVSLPIAAAQTPELFDWYARGDWNGWGITDPMVDDGTGGDVTPGDGIYSAVVSIGSGGRYEFKVATEDWGTSYPGSGNSWLDTAGPEDVTITFDTNTYADGWLPETHIIGVSTEPGAWTAVGDWQGWDNANPATAMAPLGGGMYQIEVVIASPGSYQYKAVKTGSWDAIGADGRSVNAATAVFETTEADQTVVLRLDAVAGRIHVEVVPPYVPIWFARGDFNGWGTTDPMFDNGTGGDVTPGDGIYTAVVAVGGAGRYEFKVATEDWGTSYPGSGNSWLDTAGPEDVTITFDTNAYADGWLPETHIIGVSTEPGAWTAVGGWQGWDNANPATAMAPLGDGLYQLATSIASPGVHEYKAVKTGTWDAIGADGRSGNAATVVFETTMEDQGATFTVDALAGRVRVELEEPPPVPGHDDDIWWDGLGHDSRDDLYRVPWGAVTTGTPVLVRLRTFHNDVTEATVRLYSTAAGEQTLLPMEIVATSDEPPYGYDYWQAEVPAQDEPTILYYRFIVRDGSDVDYYEDDDLFDGGWGAVYDQSPDFSFQIDVYLPDFDTPQWAQDAVIYQIFPDRFYNGNMRIDPSPDDPTVYGNEVLVKGWDELPEGYCRAYEGVPCDEGPMGRDFFGGDLNGVLKKLDYLADLGVTAVYFNPIFQAPSNHLYDTTDYFDIDDYFGSKGTFQKLVEWAGARGIHIILDGVFNHTSSDSLYFDKYSRYPKEGAYESQDSRYFDWYTFYEWPDSYNSWWGFDSLPVLTEIQEVRDFIYANDRSVARWWVEKGAAGWRLDVAPDKSHGFWQGFRVSVKDVAPDSLIIGEIWDDASSWILGNELDTTMNYRFRRALIGFVNGETNDPNQGLIRGLNAEQFAAQLLGIQEDYPAPAFWTAMNLVSTHDTQRILWVLTPGARNREEKEFNPANLAEGKAKQKLLAILQMTLPGAPTIYYGDEVALTGDTDPDDRRPFPWGSEDTAMLAHYQALTAARNAYSCLRTGSFQPLYTNNDDATLAYGRKDAECAAMVAVNQSPDAHELVVPLAGLVPDGTVLTDLLTGDTYPTSGQVTLNLAGRWGAVLITPPGTPLTPPLAPENVTATAGNGSVTLSWTGSGHHFDVWRSLVTGGGYVKINPADVMDTQYEDTTVVNGQWYYYVITASTAEGMESERSAEASALPSLPIDWANLQWPPSIEHTISAINPTENIYGQVWIDGETYLPGPTPGLDAQAGYGPDGSDPSAGGWTWYEAAFNTDAGNNDEFVGNLLPDQVGVFDYCYRYSTTGGDTWVYADLDGTGNGYDPAQAGDLTVVSSGDTDPPDTPANLVVIEAAPGFIHLGWDPVAAPDLYGYRVYRGQTPGGPYDAIDWAFEAEYVDWDVIEGQTYTYVVSAVDTSFNESGTSNEVEATAQAREVLVTFNVVLPPSTPPIGEPTDQIYMGGSFNGWDPGGTLMNRTGDFFATLTLPFLEGEQLEYKYTRGSWDYVEKGAECEELPNRTHVVNWGSDGTMVIEEEVLNWRNTGDCGP